MNTMFTFGKTRYQGVCVLSMRFQNAEEGRQVAHVDID